MLLGSIARLMTFNELCIMIGLRAFLEHIYYNSVWREKNVNRQIASSGLIYGNYCKLSPNSPNTCEH